MAVFDFGIATFTLVGTTSRFFVSFYTDATTAFCAYFIFFKFFVIATITLAVNKQRTVHLACTSAIALIARCSNTGEEYDKGHQQGDLFFICHLFINLVANIKL
jgi:hypothetical protein